MLYRKSELSVYRYFLKSINKLWLIPIVIINVIVPLISYLLYITLGEGSVIYILDIIYLLLPVSSVWTSIFVSEVFFSEKAKDILFFYPNKKRVLISVLFYFLSAMNASIIVMLHFYVISDWFGTAIKIMCISVLFYGLSMLILRLSKSTAMSLLITLLYSLVNEFSYSNFILVYKTFGDLTMNNFLLQYLPLSLIGILFAVIAFLKFNFKHSQKGL